MPKRTAGLNLEWRRVTPDQYRAVLPNIPDYTTGSSDNFVEIDDTGEGWMFSIWLELVGDISICLFNSDFGIPFGSSFEEMKQAVENLSIEDIVRKVAERGDKPVDDEFTDEELKASHQLINQYATASRHASKRSASIYSSDFVWEAENGGAITEYPYCIPGYPGDLSVCITPMEDPAPDETCPWDVIATYFPPESGYSDGIDVDCRNFSSFVPDDETLEGVERGVEKIGPTAFFEALELDSGIEPMVDENDEYVVASRRATRRTAGLGTLDWEEYDPDDYGAELPSLPGYPYPIGFYVYDTEKGWWFEIGDGKTDLDNTDFDIPTGSSAEEMMTAVENLDPQDVADKLTAIGYAPDENMDWPHTVASCHATRRTARMDLNWEFNANMLLYEAALPAIPDYPGVDSVDVWKDDEDDRWCFALCQNGYPLSIRTNDEFGIPSADTAEEMMDAVENLDPEEIADVLAAHGYEPDED